MFHVEHFCVIIVPLDIRPVAAEEKQSFVVQRPGRNDFINFLSQCFNVYYVLYKQKFLTDYVIMKSYKKEGRLS